MVSQRKITFFTTSNNKRRNDNELSNTTKKRAINTEDSSSSSSGPNIPADTTIPTSAPTSCPLPNDVPSEIVSSTVPSDEVQVLGSKSFCSAVNLAVSGDLNENAPNQKHLENFPSSTFGKSLRSFKSTWYKSRPWLEYSVEKDAAFCFPCRVFGVNPPETIFTIEGYRDWQHALDGWNNLDHIQKDPSRKKKMKGFAKHAASSWHKHNLATWTEKKKRESSGSKLENIVLRLENDQRKWVEVIYYVIRHLAADGLPLRGKLMHFIKDVSLTCFV